MTEEELQLFSDIKVMYQTGKGNHLVPFLVPQDTQAALDKLSDEETRNDSGILPTNDYLFPSTKYSTEHVYGRYAVRRICIDAGVTKPSNLTATKMRHRVSTLYASLDLPENQRCHFYKHMGHSASTNASIYQAPLAEIEISQVGKVLQTLDRQTTKATKHSDEIIESAMTLADSVASCNDVEPDNSCSGDDGASCGT